MIKRSYDSGLAVAAEAAIDLQTHTLLSDGTWTPEALIAHFVHDAFAVAAITDHDRVDCVAQVQQIAHAQRFPLLVAVEMTTQWRGQIVDILCFGFEDDPAPLSALCDRLLQEQVENSRQVYHNLVRSGYLTEDAAALSTILSAPSAQQPHLLFDLFVRNNPALADHFGPMRAAGYRLCANPTETVVEAAHRSGGVALIAHPGRTDGFVTFDTNLLDQFRAEIAIDGLETAYPRHSAAQAAFYETYAHQLGWLTSAGSDSHTPEKPPIRYPARQCAALLARLDIRVI